MQNGIKFEEADNINSSKISSPKRQQFAGQTFNQKPVNSNNFEYTPNSSGNNNNGYSGGGS
jgi:hypothetical protein